MSLRINQNVLGIQTYGQLEQTSGRLEKSIEKLSTGLRINRASDDAAGLAISEKLRSQVRGLSRAILNSQDGVSMIQTGEGALNESQAILQRMRELALQAANDALTGSDRLEIQNEVTQLRDDLNRIANQTEFNTKRLLDGSQTALVSSTSAFARGIPTADAMGGEFEVSLELMQAGLTQKLRSQMMRNRETGDLADGSTKLVSITQFYGSDGTFALDLAKTLTIVGNAKTVGINVHGEMTLRELSGLIYQAIRFDFGLGMSGSSVSYITSTSSGLTGVGGYLDITSGLAGTKGTLGFVGEQQLIDSLGLSTIREAVDAVIRTTAKGAGGQTTSLSTNDGRAVGLLQGIDLKFTSQSATIAGTGGIVDGIKFAATVNFTISGNDTWNGGTMAGGVAFSIAAGSWTMEGLVRNLNAQITSSIGLNTGFTANLVDGEVQFSYVPNTTGYSDQFNILQDVTVLGIYSGTKNSSYTGTKSTEFTDRATGFSRYNAYGANADNAISYSLTTGLAGMTWTAYQATGSTSAADMVEFSTFRTDFLTARNAVAALSAAVDLAQIGSTVVFSSKLVGTQAKDDGTIITSRLSLKITADTTGVLDPTTFDNGTRFVFNFWSDTSVNNSGTQTGVGDANFRVQVTANSQRFQIGPRSGEVLNFSIRNMGAEALGVDDLDVTSTDGAMHALSKIDEAMSRVSSERSRLGAYINRLEYAIDNLRNTYTNMVSAESRIRDTDVALEVIEFTRDQLVNQSGTAMLAQANLLPQNVLSLLK